MDELPEDAEPTGGPPTDAKAKGWTTVDQTAIVRWNVTSGFVYI